MSVLIELDFDMTGLAAVWFIQKGVNDGKNKESRRNCENVSRAPGFHTQGRKGGIRTPGGGHFFDVGFTGPSGFGPIEYVVADSAIT